MSKDVTELTAALMELGWMDFTGIGFPLNTLNCFIAKGYICLEGPKSLLLVNEKVSSLNVTK